MNKNHILPIVLATFVLISCGRQATNNYIVPQQINDPLIAEISPTFETQIERVNNCDGANPTYNVSYKTIETQNATFEVSVGAGGLVTGTPIPSALEVQLEAKITAALAKDYGLTTEKNHDITLNNIQGTYLEHLIEWKVTRVKGLVEVIYGDGVAQVLFDKIANVELYNRTSHSLGCPGNSTGQQPPAPSAATDIPVATFPATGNTPHASFQKGHVLYECDFIRNCEWNVETGVKIEEGALLVSPGYDAVLGSSSSFTDFVLEAKFLPPPSGSMSFYIRHQRPVCADWNCSIQIGIYHQELVARRFLGDELSQQFDIIKNKSANTLSTNDWNTIVIAVQGNSYKAYVNGIMALEFTDDTYRSGSFIIDNAKDSTGEVKIDDFKVYAVE